MENKTCQESPTQEASKHLTPLERRDPLLRGSSTTSAGLCPHLQSRFAVSGPHIGEWCKNCGKWIKWYSWEQVRTILEYAEIDGYEK